MTPEEYQAALERQQAAIERDRQEREEALRLAEEIAQRGQPVPGTNFVHGERETVRLPDGTVFTKIVPSACG